MAVRRGRATGLDALCPALDAALEAAARRAGVGLILWKDVPSGFRRALAPLRPVGNYARFPSLPGVRLPLECASFEEFLATRLGKSTRKSLRRKFRDLEERTVGEPVTLEVKHELTEAEAGELHLLYETVARRGEVQFEVFPREYFYRLSQRMPGRAHSFLWRWRGEVVAFAFCMVEGDTLFDNDLGLDYRHAHDLHLYHLTFRDLYDWAVTRGLKFYRSSPAKLRPEAGICKWNSTHATFTPVTVGGSSRPPCAASPRGLNRRARSRSCASSPTRRK